MKICVFCGGSGTRMWPVSRKRNPKQFQPILGNKSLFQATITRLTKGFDIRDIYVVTGKEYKEIVKKQMPNLPSSNLIIEPEMRDTLAAVGYAAAYLKKKFPNEVMAAIWGADHIVKNEKKFITALKLAEKLAEREKIIVKVDVRPTFPSVHLGYVQIGRQLGTNSGFKIYEFIKHVEKPDFKTARKYLNSKKYLWNTGYLVWNLTTIMKLYEKHVPEVYRILKGSNLDKEISKKYSKIPKTSIDYALFEKLSKNDQIVIDADLGWSDIGAWNILRNELPKNKDNNVISGQHIGLDTKDSLIYNFDKNKIIATIGLQNMIVVDTKDGLLICPADRVQDIKKIIEKLKKERKVKYL